MNELLALIATTPATAEETLAWFSLLISIAVLAIIFGK